MALKIETFSSLKGGNSFFKAVTHPEAATQAAALIRRLSEARSVAIYDPLGFATGFAAVRDLSAVRIAGVYVQAVTDLGQERLGHATKPVTALAGSAADLVFVTAFDAERLTQQIAHLVPAGAEVVSLDELRLEQSLITNPRNYLDPLNFATNFAFFRDRDGSHSRVVTANYWSNYGAKETALALTLFDADGQVLARWREALPPGQSAVVIDSRRVRARFGLPAFEGQLFIHAVGGAGHDVVKYALDTFEEDGPSLSCTHDANAWPADFYAGLPAPRADERVVLWVQNSLPIAIPPGGIALNLMGDAHIVPFPEEVAPFATVPLDVASLLPEARWPQQIEIAAGKYVVRPRYEVIRGPRTRIAHPNVERTDLKPDPKIAELGPWLGKGFILPAPILPPAQWSSLLLPTPMALSQAALPIQATAYDPAGRALGTKRFGRLARRESVELALDELVADATALPWGHVELTYDFAAGTDVDGWLHALFRYENRASGHAAETSFGAHVFNTVLTYKDEPQSYAGRPPGLSTRLFLRLGAEPLDTLCHLVYPASTPWHPLSETDLTLLDATGREVARRRVQIPCGGSLFWRYHETFTAEERAAAGTDAYIVVRDTTCRLFGYHGLAGTDGRFSLDHMFGF
ncbi:hypothetical protein GCM10011611_59570 [Aliidongia dinghuensis]|uniref:Uncharacterized protein n=2 Tax=Aliidongia dinghuensis TaxID=1867774 RepID=A0A8J3E6J7_9PROT|nr:hypothetical protein GCM10011611_59570 [Aliidongia dinghuensis]